jgi:simple sugar transport system permease protein
VDAGRRNEIVLGPWRGLRIPALLGLICGALVAVATASQVSTKFGVLAVLLVTPCVALALGAINGAFIVAGRLQPFIATLAMMVSALGLGRLTAGQDHAVIAVYTGTNATEAFEVLRSMVWGILPMPSVFFLAAILIFGAVLRFTTFGRYIYAIGGNPEAAKLSGIKVAQVQLAAYMISGLLAGFAGVLFVAQYRQGKPDAGSGLELDAIAACVIGGTSLMGGRGGLPERSSASSSWLALRYPSTPEHRFQRAAPDEGAYHRRHGARAEQNLGQLLTRWRGQPSAAAEDRIGRSPSGRHK